MEEKGLSEALNVLEGYVQTLIGALLDTLLLPLRLLEGLLQ